MNKNDVMIMDVPFIHTTHQDFIDRLDTHAEQQDKCFVVTANPEIVMHAHEDSAYKEDLKKATYITADGIGIVKAAGILGHSLPERVSGYDVMMDLLKRSNKKNYNIYLLGASANVIEKTAKRISLEYPHLTVAGYHDGFFDWEDPSLSEEIRLSRADFIFVALGFPRQEKWIAQNFGKFDKGIFIGVGGSFDVIAGEVQRAPLIWQKANLEWLYRLLKQPSRWKRMLVLPRFALKIIKMRIAGVR